MLAGGGLIGYAFGVVTKWLLKLLQRRGAAPPQVLTPPLRQLRCMGF